MPQRLEGHFKDYEVGANCIVLLILQCLMEGGVLIQFLWPKCLPPEGQFGRAYKSGCSGCTRRKRSMWCTHGATTPLRAHEAYNKGQKCVGFLHLDKPVPKWHDMVIGESKSYFVPAKPARK